MQTAEKPLPETDTAAPPRSLTEGLVALCLRPVDAATRAKAALHLLDWLGCAAIGATTPPGRLLARHAAEITPAGPCAALGLDRTLDVTASAYFHGGLGNVMEMDDIHRSSILHPGPVVVPAALAMAARQGAAGPALLDAIVRGYEAAIRIGRSVGPGHYAKWHNTATCGPFGAAMAAGDLLGLTGDSRVHALGNAGTVAAGLWRCRHEPVMSKQLHNAHAAEAGVNAALLASLGFTGAARILEGAQGFYDAMCPDAAPEKVLEETGHDWMIWDTGIKPWPACRHAHAAIDAALALRRDHAPDPESIAAIDIVSYGDAISFCDRVDPETVIEAKFSLQHAVAISLIDGEPPLEAFDPPAFSRMDVAALRHLCTVRRADPFDRDYPERYGASLTLTLKDGQSLQATISDALGDPANPLDEEKIIAKARMLMTAAGARPADQDRAIAAAFDLAGGAPVTAFLDCLPGLVPAEAAR